MVRSLSLTLLTLAAVLFAASAFAAEGILVDTAQVSNTVVSDVMAADADMTMTPAGIGAVGQPVPEPATLLALGAAGSLFFARRKKKA
jgi:hypothetical protein